ncbi:MULTISPECIES: DUF998 domain-containing protein [Catenuloplanes]|uniref:Membrane protein n=1 Tax=Catenuloplanes niger TaxID=587534 RepID=A0AAE3ZMY6_9ACTN|nr:DUF998 domain-containing protein [Catenuloplanes niger]MDR7321098.1 putative membrane protein [Catenuloplanes niger]
MRTPALVSSAAAPVLLIGGWLLAESRQPPGFDPLRDAISDLAALDAADRQIMTAALLGVGLAHLVTAAGLTEVSRAGRLLIAAGGIATALVGVFPLPAGDGGSTAHTVAATVAFTALAVWPFTGGSRTGLLRRPATLAAGTVLLALVAWFGATLAVGGPLGLAERTAAAAQALWPFVVALSIRTRSEQPESYPPGGSSQVVDRLNGSP